MKGGLQISTLLPAVSRHRGTMTTQRKLMTTGRGANRAAEHGHRSLVTQSINIEEAEEEINKGKEEKQRKVEQKLDDNDSDDFKGTASSSSK